ncbi:LVIVD repeat-containing protein [Corallococcus terminator]
MTTAVRGVLVASLCLSAVSGCSRELTDVVEVPVNQGPTQILEDHGDWAPEPLATCPLLPRSGAAAECGTPESFDLSACERDSLTRLNAVGHFTVNVIGNDILQKANNQFTGAMNFLAEGGVLYDGRFMREVSVEGNTFFLSNHGTLPDGRAYRSSFVGCEAPNPGRVMGCYVSCLAGEPTFQATFEAEKVQRRAGEEESQGLTLVGEAVLGQGVVADVFVTQGHAYVVSLSDSLAGPGGLFVYDLSDRSQPRLVNSITYPGDSYWNSVWAKGNALYVASAARGLLVFDIAEPANPKLLRSLPDGRAIDAHTIHGDNDRLYVMSASPTPETLIFNVKNEREPVLLGRYADPSVNPMVASFPHDATSWGTRLFVNHWAAGLLVLDVSDPTNVVKQGEYVYPRATSHTNRWHYVNNRLIVFEGGEDWGAHVRALDMTDLEEPVLIGEYRLSQGVSVHNMELKDGLLYLAHYQHGVRVLDVTRPSQMREVAYFNTWRGTDRARGLSFYDGAIGMRIPGDGYVYVIDTSRGLLIFEEL